MATNPKTVPIANKVDDTQLQTLASGGSITKGGDTYTADERALYLTEETIDTTPTANSDNLVTSGGVYDALGEKADTSDIPTVNNPTITVTQGGVTKGSFTLNQSSAQTIALDAGGGSSTDVQINSTSITSGGVANIQTKGTYNASTNKIATESDLPPAVTITTTSGSESVSDGTNTLNFGANAFNSTTIPTSYVSSVNGNTGVITNVPIQSSTTTTAYRVLWSTTFANTVAWSGSALGSTTKPIYLNSSGVLSEGNTYAGGTAVTLNATTRFGQSINFFAPTTGGGAGQILKSNGPTYEPSWTDLYPVGAVYLSTVNTSPASVFGGTWTALDEGYALWTTTTTINSESQGKDSGSTVYRKIPAGLPNISGQPDANFVSHSQTVQDGALTFIRKGAQGGLIGSGIQYGQIKIDASQSNSIYGNSTTVQPPAYRVYAWKRTA